MSNDLPKVTSIHAGLENPAFPWIKRKADRITVSLSKGEQPLRSRLEKNFVTLRNIHSSNLIEIKNREVIQMKVLRILQLLLLGVTLVIPLSIVTVAQPRTDFWGSGDSGAGYDFYLDYMYPKRTVGPLPGYGIPGTVTKKVKPRTDFYGSGDSGAAYDFYLDWMYPKRNVGPKPAPAPTKPMTAKVKPRTSYDGPGDSGAAYDFYLDWMSPRIKPKSPRIIPFLTFKRSYEKGQAVSQNE
jgi:hypothetical protein